MKKILYFFVACFFFVNHITAMPSEIDKMQKQFFDAADNGDVAALLEALEFPIDVNAINENKESALMRAAFNDYPAIIKAMRVHKKAPTIDPNLQDIFGNSVLHLAASIYTDNPYLISELLFFPGINISLENYYGWTILAVAAKEGRMKILNRLLAKDNPSFAAQIQPMANHEDKEGKTPLMLAVNYEKVRAVQRLLDEAFVNVNYENSLGETALIIAAGIRDTSILQIILNDPRLDLAYKDQGSRACKTAKNYDNANAYHLIKEKLTPQS